MQFTVVTPVRDGARYIDEAVLSVVAQAGPFSIRYHVQDGGSSDGTVGKLARWQERLAGALPPLCHHIEFTDQSARDHGMYDAIGRGFLACGEGDIMAWINADDRYEPGAFAAVAQIFDSFDDVDWLCGQVLGIDGSGAMIDIAPPAAFPRAAITAGIFDGRHCDRFIQQPGAFWRPRLWQAAGGVDAHFRLAGDFDLWRRFSRHADLVTVEAIWAAHRMHGGRLTSDMTAYYAELDASLSRSEAAARAAMTERFWEGYYAEPCRDDELRYRVVRPGMAGWACDSGYIPLRTPEMEEVYRSTCWRITAPLRTVAKRWQRARGRRYGPVPESRPGRPGPAATRFGAGRRSPIR